MTLDLGLLSERYVFQSTPSRLDLGALHVPFDELTSTAATETRLAAAGQRAERTALIGSSGSGKSSVVAHVFGPLAEGVAPIVVPVAAMPAQLVASPDLMADHLLATLTRHAGTAGERIKDELAPTTETQTTTRAHGLGGAFGWLTGEMAREVERQTRVEIHADFIDKADALSQVLELVASDRLQPVLVFDDTDRWLGPDDTELARTFFAEGLRWLLDLPTSLVVAVHPHYFGLIERTGLLQYLDTQIEVPRLDTPDAIESILARRIELYADVDQPRIREVLETGSAQLILDEYQLHGSLRRALQVCHIALHDALADGSDRITPRHVAAASHAG